MSVCLSHGAAAIGAQLPWAIGTLAACSLAMCILRARPRTDVDPPRVEPPSAGAYRLTAPGGDNLFIRALQKKDELTIEVPFRIWWDRGTNEPRVPQGKG